MSQLTCQKALFQLPVDQTFLNSAYMGPLPRPTIEAARLALEKRASVVGLTAADFFAPADRVRELLAQLVHTSDEKIAFVSNVAAALGVVVQNFRAEKGQKVVILEGQFPSNVFPWRRLKEKLGLRIDIVRAQVVSAISEKLNQRARRWNDDLLAAIDSSTALVAIETAHWTDGTAFNLHAVAERCRQMGAALIIDGTQTVGVMPFSVEDIKPDLLVVHAYKAMLGGYGLGFAVFGERFSQFSPLEEGWLVRRDADDFSGLLRYQEEYAPGARRFDCTARANNIMMDMLESSVKLLLQWNPQSTSEYLREISRRPIERLREGGFGVIDEDLRAPNIVGIYLPSTMRPLEVQRSLVENRIHVSVRGDSVRVSPHVYNDEADLWRLVEALAML